MTETSQPNRRGGDRRARGLPGTLGLTGLSTLLPGGGLLVAGRRPLGLLLLVPALALAGGSAGTPGAASGPRSTWPSTPPG